jgi:hypothetical protein
MTARQNLKGAKAMNVKRRPRRANVPDDVVGTEPARAGVAEVVVTADSAFVLDVAGTPIPARRALSCLLLPEVGDIVAWCHGPNRTHFIYAVLVRTSDGERRLSVEGDAALEASGQLRVSASRLEASAGELRITSATASLVFGTVESIGEVCRGTFNQLKLIGTQLTQVFERTSSYAQHQQRTVEGCDQVRAGTMDYRADRLMNLQAENVVTSGERLVKTRGAQIHLG